MVVGSDDRHVGTVDNLVIKLTKNDPAAHGRHHPIRLDLVASVEGGRLTLDVPAADATRREQAVG